MSPARSRLLDIRLRLVSFGGLFAWTEITPIWHHWSRAGQIFSDTAFIPLQLASADAIYRASRRPDLASWCAP